MWILSIKSFGQKIKELQCESLMNCRKYAVEYNNQSKYRGKLDFIIKNKNGQEFMTADRTKKEPNWKWANRNWKAFESVGEYLSNVPEAYNLRKSFLINEELDRRPQAFYPGLGTNDPLAGGYLHAVVTNKQGIKLVVKDKDDGKIFKSFISISAAEHEMKNLKDLIPFTFSDLVDSFGFEWHE